MNDEIASQLDEHKNHYKGKRLTPKDIAEMSTDLFKAGYMMGIDDRDLLKIFARACIMAAGALHMRPERLNEFFTALCKAWQNHEAENSMQSGERSESAPTLDSES